MSITTKPEFYPNTANSGIYDAGFFYVGESDKFHSARSFPDAVTVTGRCGVVASLSEGTSRPASWASGYDGSECPTCFS